MKRLLPLLLCVSAFGAEYVELDNAQSNVVAVVMMNDAQLAEAVGRAGQNKWRPVFAVTPPSPGSFEVVTQAVHWTVTPTNAFRAFGVRPMNQQELEELRTMYVSRVAEELESRVRFGQWESGMTRVDALQSELAGLMLQAYLLNTELLQLVTKAVAGTVATNNLTAPERARVASLRSQLSFAQAPDFTQDDRNRAIEVRAQLVKVYDLWRAAQAVREATRTNTVIASPNTSVLWPDVTIGE